MTITIVNKILSTPTYASEVNGPGKYTVFLEPIEFPRNILKKPYRNTYCVPWTHRIPSNILKKHTGKHTVFLKPIEFPQTCWKNIQENILCSLNPSNSPKVKVLFIRRLLIMIKKNCKEDRNEDNNNQWTTRKTMQTFQFNSVQIFCTIFVIKFVSKVGNAVSFMLAKWMAQEKILCSLNPSNSLKVEVLLIRRLLIMTKKIVKKIEMRTVTTSERQEKPCKYFDSMRFKYFGTVFVIKFTSKVGNAVFFFFFFFFLLTSHNFINCTSFEPVKKKGFSVI